jgi:outer membrane murein-binding lipoprotein Lpp
MKKLIVGAIIVGTIILAGNALLSSFFDTMSARTAKINMVIDRLN